jgi:hypothetical protein
MLDALPACCVFSVWPFCKKEEAQVNSECHCIALIVEVRAVLLIEMLFWRSFCGKWLG